MVQTVPSMIRLKKYGVISTFLNTRPIIHCRVPRVKCGDCGVHQIEVPWARKQSGFTFLMDAIILTMAQSMPILKVAKMLDEHDTRDLASCNILC